MMEITTIARRGKQMNINLLKLDLFLYLWLFVSTFCCSLLFVIWWIKIGKVSFIYKIVLGILLGIAITESGSFVVAIYKHLGYRELVISMTTSWWWSARMIPLCFFITIFIVHMIWRFSNMDTQGKVSMRRRWND